MKRRLTIARSLINEPSILLLDEPTTGLDPQARHLLWDRLYRLKQRGVTLVLTTHYMDEAEQLCDRLVVMDKAKIVAEGSPRQLIERVLDHARSPSSGSRSASRRRSTASSTAWASASSACPDRVLVYSDDGEAVAAAAHQRGLRAGDGARPAELARGRVPAPDRPEPHRLMAVAGDALRRDRSRRATGDGVPPRAACGRGRRVRAHVAALPADLARLDLRHFAQPVLFLLAMGVGLGGYVDQASTASLGGVPYLAVPRAGAARVDRHAGLGVRGARSRSSAASAGSSATTRCTPRR